MVWPFSVLWGRSKAAPPPSPSPAKKVARKMPASPSADAALLDAWQGRTVGALRDQLEEVGWDVESLDRLLARVGAPEDGAPEDAGARRTKRARSPIRLHDDNEQDEEIDLPPRLTSRKQATLSPPGAKSPPQRANQSPPGSPAPRVQLTAEVGAMSPSELKAEFARIFGYPPRSGNLAWLRRKLDALQNGTDLNVEGRKGRRPVHTLLGSPGHSPPASPQ
jgi:hypothetical protein